MTQSYQTYYRNILNDKRVPSILFNSNPSSYDKNPSQYYKQKGEMFPQCGQSDMPQFFKLNLVSPNRIIKYVSGQNCVYRGFYFQLFKLMFQIQNQDKDYVQIFKQIIFDPDIIQRNGQNSRAKRQAMRNSKMGDISGVSQMSEEQNFRREFMLHQKCVGEFMEMVLENERGFSSFEEYLLLYRGVDDSMCFILESLIDSGEEEMDSIQSILEYLSQLFEIQLVVFQNCFKFEESDVFFYIQQKDNQDVWIYIAYNEDDDQNEQSDEDRALYQNSGQEQQEQEQQQQQQGQPKQQQQAKQAKEQEEKNPKQDQIKKLNQQNYLNYNPINSHNNPTTNHQQLYSSINHQQIHSSINNQQLYSSINKTTSKLQRSSSYHDTVITSEMKPQLYNQSQPFFYQPSQNRYPSNSQHSSSNTNRQLHQNLHFDNVPIIKSSLINPSSSISQQNSHIKPYDKPFDSIVSKQSLQKNNYQPQTNTQNRDFHKKLNLYNQNQVYEQKSHNTSELSKFQSFTQTYQEDHFHNTNQQPFLKKGTNYLYSHNTQNSIQGIQIHDNSLNKRGTDSKAQTIINMFGDMLGSTANINSFDNSQKHINGVYGSAKNFTVQEPHHDNENSFQSIKKRTEQFMSSKDFIGGNVVNMKKAKLQSQVIFEAKPSSEYSYSQIQINQAEQGKERQSEGLSWEERKRGYSMKNNQVLIDSEQLRNQNQQQLRQNRNLERERGSSFNVRKSNHSSYGAEDYLENIEARSYGGDEKRVPPNQKNSDSSHNGKNSSQNSNNINHHQSSNINSNKSNQSNIQAPKIQVNSVKSASQTSSKQLKNRNNYYEPTQQIPKQKQVDLKSKNSNDDNQHHFQEKQLSIKSQQHQSSYNHNTHKYSQIRPTSPLNHQYKSQQYISISRVHQINIPKPPNKALTSNYQPNKFNNQPPNQNVQEEDDFFFHPNNLSTKYGLKTIKEVRASKQTNKESYIVPQNQIQPKLSQINSQISQNNSKIKQINSKISQTSSKISQDSQKPPQIQTNKQAFYRQNYQNKQFYKTNQSQASQISVSKKLSKVLTTNIFQTKKQQVRQFTDDSVNNGTFYKQFTNSKVLKLLKQPYRTKVQILKNRFKGQHRPSINKVLM